MGTGNFNDNFNKNTETKNNENFAAMLEESLALKEMRQGEIITAEVVGD